MQVKKRAYVEPTPRSWSLDESIFWRRRAENDAYSLFDTIEVRVYVWCVACARVRWGLYRMCSLKSLRSNALGPDGKWLSQECVASHVKLVYCPAALPLPLVLQVLDKQFDLDFSRMSKKTTFKKMLAREDAAMAGEGGLQEVGGVTKGHSRASCCWANPQKAQAAWFVLAFVFSCLRTCLPCVQAAPAAHMQACHACLFVPVLLCTCTKSCTA